MKTVFVYSYSRLLTKLGLLFPPGTCVYATFRQEFLREPVTPLYAFSKRQAWRDKTSRVLTDNQIENAFEFSSSMGLITGRSSQVIALGRMYEQFFLSIFDREGVDSIVNHNLAMAYQKIGHLLAKKMGIRTWILDFGYFRPFTLTIEENGFNSSSVMATWKFNPSKAINNVEVFRSFLQEYKSFHAGIRTNKMKTIPQEVISSHDLVLKALKQRLFFDRLDPETYRHNWLEKIGKRIYNHLTINTKSFNHLEDSYFCFFLSSRYDPEVGKDLDMYIDAVAEGFRKFRELQPQFRLVVKEHPTDYRRFVSKSLIQLSREENVIVDQTNTHELISRCQGAICINSGVGIEVLAYGKPLLALAPSSYSHAGLVIQLDESLAGNSVAEGIRRLNDSVPSLAVTENYLSELYWKTQLSTYGAQQWDRHLAELLVERIHPVPPHSLFQT